MQLAKLTGNGPREGIIRAFNFQHKVFFLVHIQSLIYFLLVHLMFMWWIKSLNKPRTAQ